MGEQRSHPDLFTADEAAAYLHLENADQLRNVRENYGLTGYSGVGKGFMYWREDLDKAALRVVGRDREWRQSTEKMRIAK